MCFNSDISSIAISKSRAVCVVRGRRRKNGELTEDQQIVERERCVGLVYSLFGAIAGHGLALSFQISS